MFPIGKKDGWHFFVPGIPATQGSKKGFVVQGRVRLLESSGESLRSWREAIAWEARRARGDGLPLTGPVGLLLRFDIPRPAYLPKRRRTWPIRARSGDLDKLERGVFDALTGVLFLDDAQVQRCMASKDWAGPEGPGVSIHVQEVTE